MFEKNPPHDAHPKAVVCGDNKKLSSVINRRGHEESTMIVVRKLKDGTAPELMETTGRRQPRLRVLYR